MKRRKTKLGIGQEILEAIIRFGLFRVERVGENNLIIWDKRSPKFIENVITDRLLRKR